MKKILGLCAAACVVLAGLAGCSDDEGTELNFERLSTTAVKDFRATSYEGAIVLSWQYGADSNNGYYITRTSDGVSTVISNKSGTPLECGRNYSAVDYVDKQAGLPLVNGKSYTYTIYVLPNGSNPWVDKAASSSASATAKVTKTKLDNWTEKDVKVEFKKIDGANYIAVTRPDSYAYNYDATLSITRNETGFVSGSSNITLLGVTYHSSKKNGSDGTAIDYYNLSNLPADNGMTGSYKISYSYSKYTLEVQKSLKNSSFVSSSSSKVLAEGSISNANFKEAINF